MTPLLLGIVAASVAQPDYQFVNEAGARGIGPYQMAEGMGGGIAAADYDDDGDIDLFVPNAVGVPDQFYRNLGGGVFEEIGEALGVDWSGNSRAALFFDYDGDGRLDLLVASDAFADPVLVGQQRFRLYRQTSAGGFSDATADAGLAAYASMTTDPHAGGMAAGDLDGDGDLDLVIAAWDEGVLLLRNDSGVFVDITAGSGLASAPLHPWQPLIHDFDADGLLDIFVAMDFTPNRLWINQGGGVFIDQAPAAGVDFSFNEMGLTCSDFDNDGDLDLYVTNNFVYEGTPDFKHNTLFRNDGTMNFAEIAEQVGVDNGGFGWGASFLDADRDGTLELAEANGIEFPDQIPVRFFVRQSGPTLIYVDESSKVGCAYTDYCSSLVSFDADRDGDQDIALTVRNGPVRLLINQQGPIGAAYHWLVIRPRSPGANTRAIGAVVRATVAGVTSARLITAGTSFIGQEPAEAFFGLGVSLTADMVVIEWPDGSTRTLKNLDGDRLWSISSCLADVTTQGAGSGHPRFSVPDGLVTAADINHFINAWVGANLGLADVTTQGAGIGDPGFSIPDGLITAADINHFVNAWVAGCP